jgi:hypothetical protein
MQDDTDDTTLRLERTDTLLAWSCSLLTRPPERGRRVVASTVEEISCAVPVCGWSWGYHEAELALRESERPLALAFPLSCRV